MKTIRALRQAQGWTQFELALKVGVQPQTIYLWESGRRVPQVEQMRKLGRLFELCSDDIELVLAGTPDSSRADSHAGREPSGSPPGSDGRSPGQQ